MVKRRFVHKNLNNKSAMTGKAGNLNKIKTRKEVNETGHKNSRQTASEEVVSSLRKMLCIGRSKHQDKLGGVSHKDKIYSFGSYQLYKQQCLLFVKYCKKEHGCRTLAECRPYVQEYIALYKSPSTMATKTAALCKVYQCAREDLGVDLPRRKRDLITRTRSMTRHFAPELHPELVAVLVSTGLRRHEAEQVTGNDLIEREGQLFVHVRSGKGGRPRYAPVFGASEAVRAIFAAAGDKLVFPEGIPASCPVHFFRAQYATALYDFFARPKEICKATPFFNPERHRYDANAVYNCRGDRKGEWLDKEAMLIVSKALGHNRISVAGAHYIHNER